MAEDFEPITGRCMCGAVRFRVDEPLLGALYCHCKRCQRRSGTSNSMTALTAQGSFSLSAGEDVLRSWHADENDGGYVKSFCSVCGSHTHTTNPDDASIVAIRLGCVDGDPGIRPGVHQFTAYAMPWHPLPDDGLPRYPERLGVGEPEMP